MTCSPSGPAKCASTGRHIRPAVARVQWCNQSLPAADIPACERDDSRHWQTREASSGDVGQESSHCDVHLPCPHRSEPREILGRTDVHVVRRSSCTGLRPNDWQAQRTPVRTNRET